jgi:PAS domain S-box-containing protein
VQANADRHLFLAELAEATQSLSEPCEVMAITSRMLAEHMHVDRCAYAEVENEEIVNVTGDYSPSVPSIVGRWPASSFGPQCLEQLRAGKPFVSNDTYNPSELSPEHRPIHDALHIRAVVCVPLLKQGKLTAAMAVHQATPRRWTPQEIALTSVVVARCWEALERARVSRTLRESEARYRAIIEHSPECVKLMSSEGTLLHMNPAGLRMIGAEDAASVIGRSAYDLVIPEDRERFREFNERVCRGAGGNLEFRIDTLAGRRRTMETTSVPLRCATGCTANLSMTRDVTDRVESERALAESRARLDYAVRLSKVGFWYCDLPLDKLVWDSNVREQFMVAPDFPLTIEDFFLRLHPDDRAPTRRAIEEAIENHSPYDVIYRVVDEATGTTKWIRALGGATYAPDGTPERFDGVTLDVSAERRVQETLVDTLERERDEARRVAAIAAENAHLNEQLREQDRRKDEFLATLAHELRNPLAPIRTGLGILRIAGESPQAERTRAMMGRQLGHMVRMIDDLLDISRITLGKVQLKKERIDIRGAVQSALETTLPLVESAGHQVNVQMPEAPIWIEADLTRVAQMVANLVNNAARYTPQGGRIEVRVGVEQTGPFVRVSDSGVGISAEMLPKIFDMFTQASPNFERSQGGLGIGLTLVRRLAEMHAGTVEAASEGAGSGSAFTIRLPWPAQLQEPTDHGVDSLEHDERERDSLRVLVVDDHVDGAECLATLLDLNGHQTRIEHSGQSAIRACDEFAPHLVFLDIGLPGMDGYEVARRIRAAAREAGTGGPRLVALTGWGSDEDRRQAHEAGFDRHCVKPLDPDKLAEVLADVAG